MRMRGCCGYATSVAADPDDACRCSYECKCGLYLCRDGQCAWAWAQTMLGIQPQVRVRDHIGDGQRAWVWAVKGLEMCSRRGRLSLGGSVCECECEHHMHSLRRPPKKPSSSRAFPLDRRPPIARALAHTPLCPLPAPAVLPFASITPWDMRTRSPPSAPEALEFACVPPGPRALPVNIKPWRHQ